MVGDKTGFLARQVDWFAPQQTPECLTVVGVLPGVDHGVHAGVGSCHGEGCFVKNRGVISGTSYICNDYYIGQPAYGKAA